MRCAEDSINGPGEVDEVEIVVPATGQYQAEIEGVTETQFRLTVAITGACVPGRGVHELMRPDKTPRSRPYLSIASEPGGVLALPGPAVRWVRLYLPVVGTEPMP